MYVRTYVCLHVCMCLFVCMYACVYICFSLASSEVRLDLRRVIWFRLKFSLELPHFPFSDAGPVTLSRAPIKKNVLERPYRQ